MGKLESEFMGYILPADSIMVETVLASRGFPTILSIAEGMARCESMLVDRRTVTGRTVINVLGGMNKTHYRYAEAWVEMAGNADPRLDHLLDWENYDQKRRNVPLGSPKIADFAEAFRDVREKYRSAGPRRRREILNELGWLARQ